MIGSTFWEKYEWPHILGENIIGSKLCGKNMIGSTLWKKKHD
jgi:hypothetical protein